MGTTQEVISLVSALHDESRESYSLLFQRYQSNQNYKDGYKWWFVNFSYIERCAKAVKSVKRHQEFRFRCLGVRETHAHNKRILSHRAKNASCQIIQPPKKCDSLMPSEWCHAEHDLPAEQYLSSRASLSLCLYDPTCCVLNSEQLVRIMIELLILGTYSVSALSPPESPAV